MAIYVANKKTHRGPAEYIGRPSVLGNPFAIGRDGNREEVIHAYREWFWQQMDDWSSPVHDEFDRLLSLARAGDLTLLCWCAPQQCHGDIIKRALDDALRLDQETLLAELIANTQ